MVDDGGLDREGRGRAAGADCAGRMTFEFELTAMRCNFLQVGSSDAGIRVVLHSF